MRQKPTLRVARLADEQFGVVSLEQLFSLGFTYEQVRRLAKPGVTKLTHSHTGWYV